MLIDPREIVFLPPIPLFKKTEYIHEVKKVNKSMLMQYKYRIIGKCKEFFERNV